MTLWYKKKMFLGQTWDTVTPVGPTTSPSWIAVGTTGTNDGGVVNPTYGTNAAGDLFLMMVGGRLTSVSTPSGWTLQGGPNSLGGRSIVYLHAKYQIYRF